MFDIKVYTRYKSQAWSMELSARWVHAGHLTEINNEDQLRL